MCVACRSHIHDQKAYITLEERGVRGKGSGLMGVYRDGGMIHPSVSCADAYWQKSRRCRCVCVWVRSQTHEQKAYTTMEERVVREWGLTGVTEREGMIHLCHVLAEKRRDLGVRGLWVPDPRPVHHAGGAGPGMARRLPQVRRLLAVPGRVVHVLRSRRQDVLQARLFKVRWTEPRST